MRPQITALFDIFKCKSTIFSQLQYASIKAKHTDCHIFGLGLLNGYRLTGFRF